MPRGLRLENRARRGFAIKEYVDSCRETGRIEEGLSETLGLATSQDLDPDLRLRWAEEHIALLREDGRLDAASNASMELWRLLDDKAFDHLTARGLLSQSVSSLAAIGEGDRIVALVKQFLDRDFASEVERSWQTGSYLLNLLSRITETLMGLDDRTALEEFLRQLEDVLALEAFSDASPGSKQEFRKWYKRATGTAPSRLLSPSRIEKFGKLFDEQARRPEGPNIRIAGLHCFDLSPEGLLCATAWNKGECFVAMFDLNAGGRRIFERKLDVHGLSAIAASPARTIALTCTIQDLKHGVQFLNDQGDTIEMLSFEYDVSRILATTKGFVAQTGAEETTGFTPYGEVAWTTKGSLLAVADSKDGIAIAYGRIRRRGVEVDETFEVRILTPEGSKARAWRLPEVRLGPEITLEGITVHHSALPHPVFAEFQCGSSEALAVAASIPGQAGVGLYLLQPTAASDENKLAMLELNKGEYLRFWHGDLLISSVIDKTNAGTVYLREIGTDALISINAGYHIHVEHLHEPALVTASSGTRLSVISCAGSLLSRWRYFHQLVRVLAAPDRIIVGDRGGIYVQELHEFC